ncbi:MAG: hypothetical protein HY064_05910 [Bacteroidetes bacterium]|nr:hypothetical protein [Bacteroidota bacterium]
MRKIFLPLFLFFFFHKISAQSFLGYEHSNYAGIVGASYNPASLADNNYSLDILVGGLDVEGANNYVGVKRKDFGIPDWGTQNLYLRDGRNTKKAAFARAEILLPAVMFSNDKFGWGVDMKIRTYANIDGVEPELAHLLARGLKDPADYQEFHNKHVGANACSWFEIGGTYSKTIWTGAEHFVSVGVRPKFLLGLGAAYAFVNDLEYQAYSDTTVGIFRSDLKFGHSDNFAFGANFSWQGYHIGFNPGIGLDAGIIYEFRPDAMQKDKKDKPKEWPGFRERPIYKYRIGASLTDLGIIHFRSGIFTDHYSANSEDWNFNNKDLNYTEPGPIYNNFSLGNAGKGSGKGLWMRTPLALDLFYDYHYRDNIYLSGQSFNALYFRGTDFKKVHELTRISVTARYETRWYGAWVPVSFTRMGTVSMGAGFRLGPFIFGTTDLLNLILKSKKVYNADFYFALKVPLFPTGKLKTKKGKAKTGGNPVDCPK